MNPLSTVKVAELIEEQSKTILELTSRARDAEEKIAAYEKMARCTKLGQELRQRGYTRDDLDSVVATLMQAPDTKIAAMEEAVSLSPGDMYSSWATGNPQGSSEDTSGSLGARSKALLDSWASGMGLLPCEPPFRRQWSETCRP